MNQRWPSPVEPSCEEARTLDAAIRHARRVGLQFPPKAVAIFWTDDELTACGRQCDGMTYPFERPVRVYLKRGLSPDRLLRVALHELLHSWDSLRWGMANGTQDEARAEIFVSFVLEAIGHAEALNLPVPRWTDHLDGAL